METRGRPRIEDVARQAGVSKTAVSFAFNSPERLSPDTATRIRDVAVALGYRPHPVARMLTQGTTRSLGILTPQGLPVVFANPFFASFAQGVAGVAEEAGYSLLFVSPVHGSLARAVGRATVDGFVAMGLSQDHPEVEQIRGANLPIVMVDSGEFPDHPSVNIDDLAGARRAAEHLYALGHREFLVIGIEPPAPSTTRETGGVVERRLAGYRAGLAAHGLEITAEHVVVGPASIEGGDACLMRAWEDGLRPTAILAMSDVMAVGAMAAAKRLGLRVPADISVVGFDDIDLASHVEPALTTVHQPIVRKGEEAGRLLLALFERGLDHDPVHLTLGTRLVVRSSTARSPEREEVAGGN